MSDWLKGLNSEQVEAASHNQGPLLILAGAGSGKTTVLVARTGRLISEGLAPANKICVLTFTNKAAKELKHRVSKKLGNLADDVWAGTFHGFGLQFLKKNWQLAQLPQRFGVIDSGDASSIVKDLLKEIRTVDKDNFNVEKLLSRMNHLRITEDEGQMGDSPEDEVAIVMTPRYVKRLRSLGVVDFEDLLLRPLKLLQKNPDLRTEFENQYDYVMVDEFQDTNKVQMQMVQALTKRHHNLAVVGDDDQSIYGWRGAEIQNILGFSKQFKNCKVVKLEQNYRSSGQILTLANTIIQSNVSRHGKVLRSGNSQVGDLPELFVLENEDQEVDQVLREISSFKSKGFKYKEIAVLYRSNSQGGLLEGGLRRSQIPYKITGGSALLDRKEVKDVLAYIRTCIAPNEVTFRRIINLPARGIGDKTVETIENFQGAASFFEKAKQFSLQPGSENLAGLFQFFGTLKQKLISSSDSAEAVLNEEFRTIGYRRVVEQSYKDLAAADSRWNGVLILGRILDGMFKRQGRTLDTLLNFVECMELRDTEDEDEQNKDQVQLMTLHACKGLEFPIVLLLGLEEDILPHARLGTDVDEERRLFYVGVTRAQKRLIMTRCRTRKKYGRNQPTMASRFLIELPPGLYKELADGRPVTASERTALFSDFMKKLDSKIEQSKPKESAR